jgi:hypothetical protein
MDIPDHPTVAAVDFRLESLRDRFKRNGCGEEPIGVLLENSTSAGIASG